MSCRQEPQKPFFPFGNPFRMMLPKGSYISPKLLDLLKKFEQDLADRLTKLRPKDDQSICSLSWMMLAAKLLSQTHKDIRSLIDDLELPLCNWDDKWIDVYLGNSLKLLNICIAFSSEISRLSESRLLLQYLLHSLGRDSQKDRVSLDNWWQRIGSRKPIVDNCAAIEDQLERCLDLPKIKNSEEGKVLMKAMYGVRVQAILLCSVFIAAFSGSAKRLIDLNVPRTYSWAEAYSNLQSSVNEEISHLKPDNILIKELEAADESVKALLSLMEESDEGAESDAMKDSISELKMRTESLLGGLDLLEKEVDGLSRIVLISLDSTTLDRPSFRCISKDESHNFGGCESETSLCLLLLFFFFLFLFFLSFFGREDFRDR